MWFIPALRPDLSSAFVTLSAINVSTPTSVTISADAKNLKFRPTVVRALNIVILGKIILNSKESHLVSSAHSIVVIGSPLSARILKRLR